jgi:hypothetical protein
MKTLQVSSLRAEYCCSLCSYENAATILLYPSRRERRTEVSDLVFAAAAIKSTSYIQGFLSTGASRLLVMIQIYIYMGGPAVRLFG